MLTFTVGQPRTCARLRVHEAAPGQVFLVARSLRAEGAQRAALSAYRRIAGLLSQGGLKVVHERIFGSLNVEAAVMKARHEAFREQDIPTHGPLTYVQGNPPGDKGFAGAIIRAVACTAPGEEVRTIMDQGIPSGRAWQRNGARFIVLQNIQGRRNDSRPRQARQMIERAARILRKNGTSYADVARTWFYLSGIVDWYAEFNRVRNEKYGEFGIMPGPGDKRLLLPASTGIGGDAPSGSAGAMDLLAIVGDRDSRPAVKQLTNKAQMDAFRYGSAFSRGALIREADHTFIQVSGTAAIDAHGGSLYPGDIRSQIDCTLDKIETLLEREGAGLKEICAATVFVKRARDAEAFWDLTAARGLDEFPAVCVVADVCRDELLFEIDAEAAVKSRPACTG